MPPSQGELGEKNETQYIHHSLPEVPSSSPLARERGFSMATFQAVTHSDCSVFKKDDGRVKIKKKKAGHCASLSPSFDFPLQFTSYYFSQFLDQCFKHPSRILNCNKWKR